MIVVMSTTVLAICVECAKAMLDEMEEGTCKVVIDGVVERRRK